MDYLKDLNKSQRLAAETLEGPLLVLAGAGAGKTKTVTRRILHLIKTHTASPDQILAVTFTNKAAKEMRERVKLLCGEDLDDQPTVGTFHSLCVGILRDHAGAIGLPRHFTIYDRADSISAIKSAMKEAGVDPKQFEPRTVLATISRQKGNAVGSARFAEAADRNYFLSTVADIWLRYEKIVRSDKALDFDDLLLETYALLAGNEAIHAHYQDRWRYLHVDEYQDTNKVQYEFIRLLAAPRNNICAVGDIDQNIYSWRGATIDNILQFEQHFPNAVTVLLEENYRSTKTIIAVANDIIKKNLRRKEKTLYTNKEDGEPISLFSAYDEADEAAFVAGKAGSLLEQGIPAGEIAVLYRANFQSRALEEAFLARGVPYRVLGTRFFDRKEIKDVLSYLRAALNPESRADLARIINEPARGIGKVTLLKVLEDKRSELGAAQRAKVDAFYALLARIAEFARTEAPSNVIRYIIKETGIEQSLSTKSDEDAERLENLKELVTLASVKYDPMGEGGVEALLEEAALATDQDELERAENAVSLMTVHAAKGLEFRHVFVAGLEEGLFPHERFGESVDDEEERRLFYVAVTRAKEKLYMSYANVRTIFGSRNVTIPSEFITDIDAAFLVAEERPEGTGRYIYID